MDEVHQGSGWTMEQRIYGDSYKISVVDLIQISSVCCFITIRTFVPSITSRSLPLSANDLFIHEQGKAHINQTSALFNAASNPKVNLVKVMIQAEFIVYR